MELFLLMIAIPTVPFLCLVAYSLRHPHLYEDTYQPQRPYQGWGPQTCPRCGGPKSRQSMTCLGCYREESRERAQVNHPRQSPLSRGLHALTSDPLYRVPTPPNQFNMPSGTYDFTSTIRKEMKRTLPR